MNNSFKGRHELSFLMQRADKEPEFVQGRESWPQKTRGLPFVWLPNSEPDGLRARRVLRPLGRRRTKKKVREPCAKKNNKKKQSKRDKSILRGGPKPRGMTGSRLPQPGAARCRSPSPGVIDCFRFTAGVAVIIFGSNMTTEIRAAPGPFYI